MLSVARRYAKAFIEVAEEGEGADSFGQEINGFLDAVRSGDGQLFAVLANPVFTQEERRSILDAIIEQAKPSQMTSNFLRLLLDKGRFPILPDVVRSYNEMADERSNRARVHVTAASELDAKTQKEVQAALEKATGKTIVLTTDVDPSLIGGMVARVGSTVYDSSIKSRLADLKSELLQTHLD